MKAFKVFEVNCDFIEIALRHAFYPVNLLHIFRKPFPRNTSGCLHLNFAMIPLFSDDFRDNKSLLICLSSLIIKKQNLKTINGGVTPEVMILTSLEISVNVVDLKSWG